MTITQNGSEYIIHLSRFAADAKHIQQTREFGSTWSHTWLRAGLIAFQDNGDVSLTPRGEDLLASLPHLPNDQEPAQAAKPCSKCNGSGEQPLFVSMETCSRCKGSKVEPRASGIEPAVSGHPWVLIDSEEVAQQFVGKCVQIDAPATQNSEAHEAHGLATTVRAVERDFMLTANGPIYLPFRPNVRLRLVDGDPS